MQDVVDLEQEVDSQQQLLLPLGMLGPPKNGPKMAGLMFLDTD